MKKFLAILLTLVMLLSLAACGGPVKTDGGVDMSKYPADINEWTAENFNDYYTAAGVYKDQKWVYVQDHATYYAGTAVDTCAGYMDDTGMSFTAVFIIDPESTEADGKALLECVRANKTMNEAFGNMPIDHAAGNVAFMYSFSADEAFYQAMEKATTDLFAALKITPDF